MEISHSIENDVCLVTSEGQLALENVSTLKEYISPLLENGSYKGLILDFSEITFVDSKGVSLIILTNMTLQNRNSSFALFSVNEKIMEIFNLSGLSNHIRIFESKESALKEIGRIDG